MSYDNVNIANSTSFGVSGEVSYASFFCSNDDYSMPGNGSWEASSRGVCLVTGISATVSTDVGNIQATSYGSSGTSYSQFAVIQTGTNPYTFEVTRRVSLAEDDAPPADYVEPTEKQK